MSATIAPQDMLCAACAVRLCDKCRGRCLCDHNDPIVMAAQWLAMAMAQYRGFMPDKTYAMAMEHFEALAKMLPDGVEVDTSGR